MEIPKERKPFKTKEEILDQLYMCADDLKILLPSPSIQQCRNYITEVRKEMEEKKYIVPTGKPYLALTKLVRKKFGF